MQQKMGLRGGSVRGQKQDYSETSSSLKKIEKKKIFPTVGSEEKEKKIEEAAKEDGDIKDH